MGTHYSQLTLDERYQIQALNDLGYSARRIATQLKRSNKTVSRELKRCKQSESYQAPLAYRRALYKRYSSAKFNKHSHRLIEKIDLLLDFHFSPEQIAGRLKLEGASYAVSKQTVYRIIRAKGSTWVKRLARGGKPYRRGTPATAGASLIPNRVDIDLRPAVVEQNKEIGHWEGDTVHGSDGYFVTLVERVTKTFLFARVKHKTKHAVGMAVTRLLKPYQALCHTITFDNGGEFAGHQQIAKQLGCRIYFAKPYHSWQRGLNENSNGLLRRFFPKKTKILTARKQALEDIQLLINCRPRKSLNYWSPLEVLAAKRVSLIVGI